MTGLPSAAAEDWHGTTFVIVLEVTVPAGVVTVTGPFVAPAPTRAYMMMFEPTMTSDARTPPIVTFEIPPSLTKPLPLIVISVGGHAVPPAVTIAGVAPFPPIQLVIVAAPAVPATTRPNVASTAKQSKVLTNTGVELLLLTSRALPPSTTYTGDELHYSAPLLPRPYSRCNGRRRPGEHYRDFQRTVSTPLIGLPRVVVLEYGNEPLTSSARRAKRTLPPGFTRAIFFPRNAKPCGFFPRFTTTKLATLP